MSFILDALKKSENDRQQAANPGIASVPTATPHARTPTGVWVLVGALGLTIVLLLAVLLKPAPTAAPVARDTEVRTLTEAEPIAQSGQPATSVPSPATPIDTSSPTVRREEPAPTTRTLEPPPATNSDDVMAATVDAVETAQAQTTPSSVQNDSAAALEDPVDETAYLTFNDLRASGNIGLPDLHIDLHVYSDNPSERFVFINMNQYRENSNTFGRPRVTTHHAGRRVAGIRRHNVPAAARLALSEKEPIELNDFISSRGRWIRNRTQVRHLQGHRKSRQPERDQRFPGR